MKLQSINERFVTHGTILESAKDKLNDGVLARVKFPICNVGKPNKNNRVYPRGVFEKVMSDPEVRAGFENRNQWMQEEHPEETPQNPNQASKTGRIAGIVTDLTVEKDDKGEEKSYITCEVLDTPMGQIIYTLLRAKCGIGVSTRAQGELKECEHDGKKVFEVVSDTYKYITTDFTADPSTYGALPEQVELAVCERVKEGVASGDITRKYAVRLLESMKSAQAKSLCESVKSTEAASLEFSVLVDQFMKMPESELLGVDTVKSLNESKTTPDFLKVLGRGIRIAVANAAVSKAQVSESVARLDEMKSAYAGDVVEYTEKIQKLKEATLSIREQVVAKAKSAMNDAIKVVRVKCAEQVAEKVKEVAQLKESIANLEEQHKKDIVTIKEDLVKKASVKLEEVKRAAKELVEKREMESLQAFYVRPKLAQIVESGHVVPENVVALLRQVKTVQEADTVFGKLHVALKESVRNSRAGGSEQRSNESVVKHRQQPDIDYTDWM